MLDWGIHFKSFHHQPKIEAAGNHRAVIGRLFHKENEYELEHEGRRFKAKVQPWGGISLTDDPGPDITLELALEAIRLSDKKAILNNRHLIQELHLYSKVFFGHGIVNKRIPEAAIERIIGKTALTLAKTKFNPCKCVFWSYLEHKCSMGHRQRKPNPNECEDHTREDNMLIIPKPDKEPFICDTKGCGTYVVPKGLAYSCGHCNQVYEVVQQSSSIGEVKEGYARN
jgi:hypothetical protein